jgi:pimeloyl-ACP methyl ester carboxylesterase
MKPARHFPALLWLIVSAFLPLEAQPPGPPATTKFIDVGGHKLRMLVAGSGAPTVVLESGMGDGIESWSSVLPDVARFTRVVAYDRPGLGKSELGPTPGSFAGYATELHNMLQRAGISPPYVLVGHSLGAGYLRAFAYLYKNEVRGLVFVDPFNEQIFRSASTQEKDEQMTQADAQAAKGSAGNQAEWKVTQSEVLKDFPELRTFGPPPDVPMALLIAGGRHEGVTGWQKAVLTEYGAWVADASEGSLVLDPESGHYIQRDNPQLVVSAIRRVVFPSVERALTRTIANKGVAAAIDSYRQMKKTYPAEYLREATLNTLGYQQLQAKHVDDAIALFKLNVEMYPKGFNTYDSLGEAYMAAGDRQAAIANYRKSLALNPENTNAVQMLTRLGVKP